MDFVAVTSLLWLGSGLAAAPAVSTQGSTEEILAAEDARFAAMVAADARALTELLGDDLLYVHTSGRAETKAEHLKAIGSGAIRYLAFVPSEREVVSLGDRGAIVRGSARAHVVTGGQEQEFTVRYLAVYGRESGRWRLRSWQTTRT